MEWNGKFLIGRDGWLGPHIEYEAAQALLYDS